MISTMIAQDIRVEMFIGICDFEYLSRQSVVVSVKARGHTPLRPTHITECLDYSKVCSLVASWAERPHVELVETLVHEVFEFCFAQDERIFEVEVEIIKPQVIAHASRVGVGATLSRKEFEEFEKQ